MGKRVVPNKMIEFGLEHDPGSKKDVSVRQERRVASKVGGRVQPGSGATDYNKGDVRAEKYLIECKRTDKKSYRVVAGVLDKITREALQIGRDPLLSIELSGTTAAERDWVLIPMSVFRRLDNAGTE